MRCHVRYLNPQETNAGRIKKTDKKIAETLDYKGIEFPVKVGDIPKLEERFKLTISVLVGHHGEKSFYPIYVSKAKEYTNHMELLLIENEDVSHYVLIKDFNRLMFSSTGHQHKKKYCMHCLQGFTTPKILGEHTEVRMEVNGDQAIKMPSKGSKVEFTNIHKLLPVPFDIYADFESILHPQDENSTSNKTVYQKHEACGYGYKVVCHYDSGLSGEYKTYRGSNTVNHFITNMLDEVEKCNKITEEKFNKMLKLNRKECREYNNREFKLRVYTSNGKRQAKKNFTVSRNKE
jgi:hypothetical protein